MAPDIHPTALSSCSAQGNGPLLCPPAFSSRWFEHVSVSKQSSHPQQEVTTSATGLSLRTAFTMVGQDTVLEIGHPSSPKGISRHHRAQIGGFGPFYTLTLNLCSSRAGF